jgi:sulfotransferase family protein
MKWPFYKTVRGTVERAESQARGEFFIIGTQKSGTTWLRDCLNEFVPFCKPEWYFPDLFDSITKHINTYGSSLPAETRDGMIQSLCFDTWSALNGEYRGEKSAYPCSNALGQLRPDVHPFAVGMTKKYFHNAKIVVIVRDPRAIFNSLRHYLENFREGWSKDIDPKTFAENWAQQNLQWIRDKPESIVLYENLKTDFRNTLSRTLNNLEIKHTADDLLKVEEAVYNVGKLRPKQPEIYRTGTIDEWKRTVEPRISRIILEVAGSTMNEIGYQIR